MPGKTFSYNAVVGQRTYARGFVDATVYTGEGTEEGIGGGSSDVGDVQAIIPCIQGGIGGFRNAFHSKHFELGDENLAFIAPAKVMACTVIDLLADDAAKAKEIIANFDSPYNAKNYDKIWEEIMG